MVGFGAPVLAAVELAGVGSGGNGGKVALPHIYAADLVVARWRGVRRLDGERYQQVKALTALVYQSLAPPMLAPC